MLSTSRKYDLIILFIIASAVLCTDQSVLAGSASSEKKIIKTDAPIVQEINKATPAVELPRSENVKIEDPGEKTTNEEEAISQPNTCFSSTQEPQDFVTPPPMTSPQGPLSPLGQTQPLLLPRNTSSGPSQGSAPVSPNYSFSQPFKYDELENTTKPIQGTVVEVFPETTTQVYLSSSDVNRIVCVNGDVKDVMFSQEKGLKVQAAGKNAFAKYLIAQNPVDQSKIYASVPTELFVICSDNSVFSLIAIPKKVPSQTILLKNKRDMVQENLSLFDSVPIENKITKLVRFTYTDAIPASFAITDVNRRLNVFNELDVLYKRTVSVPGEGLLLKEFVISLKHPRPDLELPVKEKDFLVPELAEKPLAISLEPKPLKGSALVRLFIVERSLEDIKGKEM